MQFIKMKSKWQRVALSPMTGVLLRLCEDRRAYTEERGHLKMETKTGGMQP